MMNRMSLLALLALSNACGGGETEPAASVSVCAGHDLALPDGSCIRPGVAPGGCGEGFVHDGVYGCEPILPADPCPPGLMAVPGEDSCRPVMDCGQGRWGDLPVDDTTQYVDGSYAGGDGDGSEAKPWSTITQGVSAAAPAALIAVAAGSYSENVLIEDKAVRLWGRCPEQVAIVATSQPAGPCPVAAVCIISGADGTEVGGLALSGAGVGLTLTGSEDVVVDRVRVHDNPGQGIDVESVLGPASLELRGSLIENNHEDGLFVVGAHVIVDGTVVRATQPRMADQDLGMGIAIQPLCPTVPCDGARPTAQVIGSLIEQNHDIGFYIAGSDVTVDATVVRTTLPRQSDQGSGFGMAIQLACVATATGKQCDAATASTATVTGSLIEQNHATGIFIDGSEATLEESVVRNTFPNSVDQNGGRGISTHLACSETSTGETCDPAARGRITVTRSLLDLNHQVALLVAGSDATVDASVVRATQPQVSDQAGGHGIAIQQSCPETPNGSQCDPATRSILSVTRSLLDQNHEVGLLVSGSDATVDESVVRATLPSVLNLSGGMGIAIQIGCAMTVTGWECDPTAGSIASVTRSLISESSTHGVLVVGSELTLDGSVVRATSPRASDDWFGDGVTIVSLFGPASATLADVLIADSDRAGVANFGAFVSLTDSNIQCAAVALNGEPFKGVDFELADGTGNTCGCPTPEGPCKLVSAGLEAPEALAPTE